MTRDYELGFILNPEVNEEQTRSLLERLEQIVTNYGGQVMRVNQWGRRRLAYPIQHNRDGFYVFVDMVLTPETVNELDRTLKVSEEVLRHIIKKRDPKVVQKEREARANAPQAATEPEGETPAEESAEGQAAETPEGEAPAEENVEQPEVPASEVPAEESAVPATPTTAEGGDVPPTPVAEETIEA